jgi:hypothetical protein
MDLSGSGYFDAGLCENVIKIRNNVMCIVTRLRGRTVRGSDAGRGKIDFSSPESPNWE